GIDPNPSAEATGLRPGETDASSKSLGTAHRAVATSEFDAQPQEFRDRWTKDTLQISGKDILVPAHGIYWLIMLHAIGFPDDQMPQLLVHGWWNLGGAKMSKSAGNIIDPFALSDKYGAEAVRYYLMSDIATGKDADFSEERLIERYNAELANNLGNLLNRTLNMANQYVDGRVAMNKKFAEEPVHWGKALAVYNHESELFGINVALDVPFGCGVLCNQFVEDQKPWVLAKQSANKQALASVLYALSDSLRIIAILMSPVLPKTAHGIFDQLNWKVELSGKEERFSLKEAAWGGLPDEHIVGKPVPLFPRIEL